MMDELVRVMNYFEEKVGNEVEMVWGAGRNDELGNQLKILLIYVKIYILTTNRRKAL